MNQHPAFLCLFWSLGIGLVVVSVNRLRNLDEYWETYKQAQEYKGINPDSLRQSSEWENGVIFMSIFGICLGIGVFLLPIVAN